MTRALISVSDKSGVVELAQAFERHGIEVVSTGGTKALLQEHGVAVTGVSDITEFPEILGGRVKTLHPRVHAGLLALRDDPVHAAALAEHDIEPIDYLVVNLYPFQAAIERPGATLADAIENIDIGGPCMLRAAAKNHEHVVAVVDTADYARVITALEAGHALDATARLELATKAFRHTAAYDAVIAQHLSQHTGERFPERLTVTYEKVQDLRYGENPHQQAAFYAEPGAGGATLAGSRQLNGKELSYNNINDANAALAIVREFDGPAAVAVKHTNPCGVGVGETILGAYEKAYAADPLSIFGGIVALNREVDAETATRMAELFLEIVMAPAFSPEALVVLAGKPNLRVLEVDLPELDGAGPMTPVRTTAKVTGGLLIQEPDTRSLVGTDLQVVTRRAPTAVELEQLQFAWRVVKHVKSNAVVLARDDATVGVGAGQMNRVGAANIAIEQAGALAGGSVMSSDAFFPMPDTVEAAVAAGITAIIQPGGSKQDQASIAAADAADIAMVFTGVRHFKH